jgi:sRNA-binding carbon storage regulator CsrA
MLVLSRNPDEAILIGDNVRIVVLGGARPNRAAGD